MSSSEPISQVGYWIDRWSEGRSEWQKEEVNPILAKYAKLLFSEAPEGRVFVPFCGKTLDLKWLIDKGHRVVGVDCAEEPLVQFFQENCIEYSTQELSWAKLLQTKDGKLQVYIGDLFSMTRDQLGVFDAIWDRASLVALQEAHRLTYAKVLSSLLAPKYRYLLSAIQYTPTEAFNGPPYSVNLNHFKGLYGDQHEYELLQESSQLDDYRKIIGDKKQNDMKEIVVLMTSPQ